MIEELLGRVLVIGVRVVDWIVGLFGALHWTERRMRENSRVGESPMEAESRRWWDRVDDRWFWLSLILLGIAAALGVEAAWG